MTPGHVTQESPGISIHDILFALLRHKWKIVIFTVLGFAAAAAYYFLAPRSYQSESKLLVKYVLERSTVDPVESQSETSGRFADGLMSAEVAILSSWDLAVQVAEGVGPDRILGGLPGEHTVVRAADVITRGLEVKLPKGSNVIFLEFANANPQVPQPVLEEFVRRYFDKHLEVHRSTQAFDFVSQQKDLVRARLSDLDAKIKNLKEQAGIDALGDSEAGLQSQIAATRQQLMAAEAALAEEKARAAFLTNSLGSSVSVDATAPKPAEDKVSVIPSSIVQQYQALLDQLALANKAEAELLTRYTEESSEVKSTRARITQLQERRTYLEQEHPALRAVPARSTGSGKPADTMGVQAQLAAIEARVAALKAQLSELQLIASKINAVSAQLQDLEAQRQVEQKNYVEFQSKLEKARIDEALDPSKIPNISILQKASPASPVAGKTLKIVGGVAVGGFVLGLVIALGLGVLLDHTIKGPGELESRLHIPMLVSIPRVSEPDRARLPGNRAGTLELVLSPSGEKVAPWDVGHFIRSYAESIRNRLILGFELKKIIHKPKLIGVTGLSGGEGASTMAGGLAASLSETGDGKVLLVDMNADNPQMRPFFEGNSSSSLVEALQADSTIPSAGENLYLATGKSADLGAISIAPRRFYELMPVLRASNFDYIIFDLPPLDQSGATLAVSGFMDKLLFMVEAEKNDRRALKRAYTELVAAKADVAAIFNKANGKTPKWALG